MNSAIIKNGKTKYIFSSDGIVMMKKDKIIQEIDYTEIRAVSYNPKFGFKDFLITIIPPSTEFCHYYKAFVIYLKSNNDIIGMRLSNDEFERVKSFFKMPVELI